MNMCERVIKKREVCEKVGVSETTLWRYIQNGKFPPPLTLPETRLQGWKLSTVNKWIDENFSDMEDV